MPNPISSTAFTAVSSDDWFDHMERQPSHTRQRIDRVRQGSAGAFCGDCGAPLSATRFCSSTGRPHASPASAASTPEPSSSGAPSLTPKQAIPNIPLFTAAVSAQPMFARTLADQMVVKNFVSGQNIFHAGDRGAHLYIVLSGQVELRSTAGEVLSVLESGKHFGEITLLYGGRRNATATAITPVVLGSLDKTGLESAMLRHKCREDVMRHAQHIPYVKQWFVSNVPLFQTCTHNTQFIDRIAASLQYRCFPENRQIIRQGEVGNEMYFLVSGQAEVVANNRRIAKLEQGAHFGEIAMLFGGGRAATIRSTNFCHVYVLDKADFDAALSEHNDCVDVIYGTAQETRYLKEHFIKQVPLFNAMKNNDEFVFNMADALRSCSHEPGKFIVREGDGGTEMFFIARGRVDVEKDGTKVASMNAGSYFGELSLLYDEPRSAGVKAAEYTHLYVLEQEAFEVIAVAFPEWWESITHRGAIFSHADRSRTATRTQNQGLSLPAVNRGAPVPSPSENTQRILQAERGSASAREALRQQLRAQGQRPAPPPQQQRAAGGSGTTSGAFPPASSPRGGASAAAVEDDDDKLCLLCADAEKCMLVVPCGHITACERCAPKVQQCPICRGRITMMYKARF